MREGGRGQIELKMSEGVKGGTSRRLEVEIKSTSCVFEILDMMT